MTARSRHAKPKSRASKVGPLAAAAVTLAGIAAAFVFLQSGPADAGSSRPASAPSSASRQALADNLMATAIHRASATLQAQAAADRARAAARRRQAAARLARQQARQRARQRAQQQAQQRAQQQAQQRAQQQAQQRAQQSPAPTQSPAPPPTGDAAHSALGICIRNAEEGGSYAWGPGNGGGAYQFLLSTWEGYGGAASAYGTAGPSYQDRIFDNAIAAGGASNWTAYDGC
ncbi:MAG: hypothetical protein ACR2FU_04715 [Streptosporangiaceae bacterium]